MRRICHGRWRGCWTPATAPFEQLPRLLDTAAKQAGAGAARLFLADLLEEVLREVIGIGLNAGEGGEEYRIEGTLPGRA